MRLTCTTREESENFYSTPKSTVRGFPNLEPPGPSASFEVQAPRKNTRFDRTGPVPDGVARGRQEYPWVSRGNSGRTLPSQRAKRWHSGACGPSPGRLRGSCGRDLRPISLEEEGGIDEDRAGVEGKLEDMGK